MKLNILVIFGLVCLVATCWARPAGEEDYAEYEDEPAPPPPPKKTPAKTPLIGNRRSPLTGRNNNKKAATTTAAPAPPKEEEEDIVEEEIVEEQAETSSTTETSKKFIKSGMVRPFRSNDDLLAALKRRREQAATNKQNAKTSHVTEGEESAPEAVHNEPAPKASKAANSAGGRRRFNSPKSEAPAAEEQTGATAAPARTGRRFSARS